MKKLFQFAISLPVVLMFFFSSCQRRDLNLADLAARTPDAQQAALIVQSAMDGSSAGAAQAMEQAAIIVVDLQAGEYDQYCGQQFDTTLTLTVNQPLVNASATTQFGYTINCNNLNIPTSFDFNGTTDSNYEAPKLQGQGNSGMSFVITDIVQSLNLTLNGSFQRDGNQLLKGADPLSMTSQVSFHLVDLKINKVNQTVESGTATFSLSGETSEGIQFNFEGDIVFLGDGQATVTINGESFDIRL